MTSTKKTTSEAERIAVLEQAANDLDDKRAGVRIAKTKIDPKGSRLKDIEGVRSYVDDYFESIEKDPPDTRYQLGYRDALMELRRLLDPAGYWRA
jgi:hypothetical protein